jgi:hypothetical protein
VHAPAGDPVGLDAAALLVPAVIAAWVVRVGVDVGEESLTLRLLAGQRRAPWSELAGIASRPVGSSGWSPPRAPRPVCR